MCCNERIGGDWVVLVRGLGAPTEIPLAGPNPIPVDFDLADFLTRTLDSMDALNKWCEQCGGRFTETDLRSWETCDIEVWVNVFSNVLSIVIFLRGSCFPTAGKTRSIPSPDPGQPWNCLHILTTSGYVRFT